MCYTWFMKKILPGLLLNGLALWAVDALFSGVSLTSRAFVITALALWLLNGLAGPLLRACSLPRNILTLGLFSLAVNSLVLWIGFRFVRGVYFAGRGTLLWTGVVLSVLNALEEKALQK